MVAQARQIPSPNHDARPAGTNITLVVVHAISLPPGQFGGDGIERLFTNRLDPGAHPYFATVATLKVSSHFLIRRGGALVQFVSCADRAWHAGVSAWNGRRRCNDFSVGIELIGDADHDFTSRQYATLARLCRDLMRAHPRITPQRIVGHSQIATPRGRKADPGPRFDWPRLHRDLSALQRR